MSSYETFFNKERKVTGPFYETIEVAFLCQACDVPVDTANYYPIEQIWVWTCDAGHRSMMEKFGI